MNEFEITGFADNISYCWFVSRLYKRFTIITFSFMESLSISQIISFFVSLVWVFCRKRNSILDIKSELLFDNLKWFPCNITLKYSSDEHIDIFLCRFVTYIFFIVLICRQWCHKRSMIRWCFFFSFPLPSSFLYFSLWERIIFICYCLVVAKWGEPSGEKFAPFSCSSHVVYDFSSKSFIFSDRIGCIENTVVVFFERDTSEIVMRIKTRYTVYIITTCPVLYTKAIIGRIYTIVDTFVSPFRVTSNCWNIHIIPRISPYMLCIFAVLSIVDVETL